MGTIIPAETEQALSKVTGKFLRGVYLSALSDAKLVKLAEEFKIDVRDLMVIILETHIEALEARRSDLTKKSP